MPDGSPCIHCGIVIDRESTANRAQCMDTPANAKFALGSTGRCRRCDRALDKHFCNKTFCNKNPYKLRLGATSCCNCWFADEDERPSFDKWACAHCKERRKRLDTGAFAGILHVTVKSIGERGKS